MAHIIHNPAYLGFLPRQSIIITEQGGFWQKGGSELWLEPGNANPSEAWDLTFPATVIYNPEGDK